MGDDNIHDERRDEDIRTGIQYWNTNRTIYRIINEAAREDDLLKKMKILSNLQNETAYLYNILKKNPDSKELKIQQNGLEEMAQGHGFVMTDKGVYLDNKRYSSR